MMQVADIFSGIGGFSLGLERAGGFETVVFCELRPFQRAILRKHWPDVLQIEDIRSIGRIDCDVICGGFPCQPFSSASRGRRVAEDLWPEMLRVVKINKPRLVIAENVKQGPIEHAAADLRAEGYNVTIRRIAADDCGAPHARSRWWLVAHPYDEGEFQRALNAEVARLPELCAGLWSAEAYEAAIRVPHGLPTGVDEAPRIALGNTVMPQIPQAIGTAIMSMETVPPVPSLGGIVAAFEAAYPELYWHIAKGKICAGEPLYGAIITTMGGSEIGDGESNVSAEDAFRIAVEDAGLSVASTEADHG